LEADTEMRIEFKGHEDTEALVSFIFEKNSIKIDVPDSSSSEVSNAGLMQQVFVLDKEVGYWIRLRQREESAFTTVYLAGNLQGEDDGVAEAEIGGSDVIMGDQWRVEVTKGSIEFTWGCKAKLGGPCSETVQCTAGGSTCVPGDQGMGTCLCSSYFLPASGKCIDGSRRLNQSCTSQKQCEKIEGRCRKDKKGVYERTCQCTGGLTYRNKMEKCVEDLAVKYSEKNMDFDRMYRTPTFQDVFPGRRTLTIHKRQDNLFNNRLGQFMPKCGLGAMLVGPNDVYNWPVQWLDKGFVVSGFYRTFEEMPTAIELSFLTGGVVAAHVPGDLVMTVKIGQEISLIEGDKEIERPGIAAEGPGTGWFYIQYACVLEMIGCTLSIGIGKGAEIVEEVFNPVYQHMLNPSKGPGIDNYNVRSLQGKVELSVECLGQVGDACSHGSQCRDSQCLPNQGQLSSCQ